MARREDVDANCKFADACVVWFDSNPREAAGRARKGSEDPPVSHIPYGEGRQ